MKSEESEVKKTSRVKLFLPVIIVCLICMTFVYIMISSSRVESVIDRIRKNGGSVQTRCILPNWTQSYSPNWVIKKFQRPYAIWLPPNYGDKELEEILEVPGLTSLTATGTQITEKCFNKLSQYEGLELLYLGGNSLETEKLEWLESQMPTTAVIY